MPDDPRPTVPAPAPAAPPPAPAPALDRAAMERVLARAAELQSSSAGAADGLSEAELLDVAREAGLSVEHVRRALAEERVRSALAPVGATPTDRGLAARIAGPAYVGAARVVAGEPNAVLSALARRLERDECMASVRRLPDGGVWEPRRDLVGSVMRGLRSADGSRWLRAVTTLGVVVAPAGDGRTLVRLEADVSGARRQRLTAGGVAASIGTLASGAVGALAFVMPAEALTIMLPLASVPLLAGAGGGYAAARTHRAVAARTHVALERLLDQLELPAPPAPPPSRAASTLLDVLDGVRRSLG